MTKQEIFERLLALPSEIAKAEDTVIESHRQVISAKDILQQKEDDLLLGNMIDGKNAEIRSAQMRQHTEHERLNLSNAELHLKNDVARLGKLRDEFRALQAVANLLQGVA
ncbi:hypothetical protein [Paenibacillus brevis]|uniref:ATPase n=1 Tax=Paenibacillus brevis TaxID=2841508 RepID=A0ABS6FSL8_9BACL|nr:hypothetical protein [Paenibacillus brevis]MBU5673208.1 hypothetical protein [Paenibacillus brevis]